jgi:hypothetical protein
MLKKMISLVVIMGMMSLSAINCYAGTIPPQQETYDTGGDVAYTPAQAVEESSMSQWWWIGAALVGVGIVVAIVAATSGSSSSHPTTVPNA